MQVARPKTTAADSVPPRSPDRRLSAPESTEIKNTEPPREVEAEPLAILAITQRPLLRAINRRYLLQALAGISAVSQMVQEALRFSRRGASLSPAPGLAYLSLSARLANRGRVFPMRLVWISGHQGLYMSSAFHEFFGTITIINLKTRPDRRRECETELSRLGTPQSAYSFFEAIRPDSPGGFPTIGYHGVFLSHLEVAKAIAKQQDDKLHVIFEDDFAFAPNSISQIQSQWSALCEADILYLGLSRISGDSDSCLDTESFCVSTGFKFVGTHAYALRPKVAALYADYLEAMYRRPSGDSKGGPMSPDGAICWFRDAHPELKTKLTWPIICVQRSSRTDIHEVPWFDRAPFIKDLAQWARRFKKTSFPK